MGGNHPLTLWLKPIMHTLARCRGVEPGPADKVHNLWHAGIPGLYRLVSQPALYYFKHWSGKGGGGGGGGGGCQYTYLVPWR